ncbi:MAG: DUF3450 family protein [Verrucomicrobiota bacterium]
MNWNALRLVGLALLWSISVQGESTLGEARSVLERWVETRQLISKTRSDWQTDRETLEQTIQMYERELAALDDQLSKISTNNTQVVREMAEAAALQKSSNETLDSVRQFATGLEGRVTRFAPQLPTPLQEILKPQLARLPADPANTKMLPAERMQVLVGFLNEVDKFNNSINVFYTEKRRNAAGAEVAVQTLYVGLGAGYFVNEAADFAGVGAPAAAGWEWAAAPGIAPDVQEAVKIYNNKKAAQFVMLPAAVR